MVTTDQAIDYLRQAAVAKADGFKLEAIQRLIAVHNSQSELFDAASILLTWLQTLPPADRPIALFNRLHDALNGVREAHQLDVAMLFKR